MAELSDLTARIEAALNDKLEPNAEIIRRFVQELETISLDSGDLLKSLRKFQEDNQTEFDLFLDALKTDQTNVYQWLLEMRELKTATETAADKAEVAAAALGYKGEWTPETVVEVGGIYGYQGSEWRSLTGADVEPVKGDDWHKIIDQKDITTGQEELIGGEIFPSDRVVEIGDTIPTGTKYIRTQYGLLKNWDVPQLPATLDNITENAYMGYDVSLSTGTFEFVTINTYNLRSPLNVFIKKTFSPLGWGAVGDFTADDRPKIEKMLENTKDEDCNYHYESSFLLNSYSENLEASSAHGNILPIYSNKTHIISGVIKVGQFFDDKNFIAFSGYDRANIVDCQFVENVSFVGSGSFDFSGDLSYMRTGYKLRKAIVFGKSKNTKVTDLEFKNGDLSNCIVGGEGMYGDGHRVSYCKFTDLVQGDLTTGANTDFTCCYCAATRSIVEFCHFKNSSQKGRMIAAAVELHKSKSSYVGGSVSGYSRLGYIVAAPSESLFTDASYFSGIVGSVANELLSFWSQDNCAVRDCYIKDCVIAIDERTEDENNNPLYFGPARLVSRSGNTTDFRNLRAYNNTMVVHPSVKSEFNTILAGTLNGIEIFNNKFAAKKVFWEDSGYRLDSLVSFALYDNEYDEEYFTDANFFNLAVRTIENSKFEFDIKNKNITIISDLLASGNKFVVNKRNEGDVNLNLVFSEGCDFEYPTNVDIFIPNITGMTFGTTDQIVNGVKTADIIDASSVPDGAILSNLQVNSIGKLVCSVQKTDSSGGITYPIRILVKN